MSKTAMFQVAMTTAAGETVRVGATFASREEAEREMVMRRAEGEYTEGRDAYGQLYAPNLTRVVEVPCTCSAWHMPDPGCPSHGVGRPVVACGRPAPRARREARGDPRAHDAERAMSDTKRFVAVGNDGFRPVIWGIGDTEEEAIADALAQEGGPTEATYLYTHPCTPAIEERLQFGDVSWVASGKPQEV